MPITPSPIKKNKMFYDAAGPPRGMLTRVDLYRFKRVMGWLYGDSVLDVGPGRADFLKLIKGAYQVAGVEINEQRVSYCNQVLGQDAVRLGNLDGKLDFEDDSFDTVVCLEVLEHLENPQKALQELVRISRKRVIVTLPFNQRIQYVLCLHCARYTPVSGHLHSFDKENIRGIIPDNASIVKIELIGNKMLNYFPGLSSIFRLPVQMSSLIDTTLGRIIPQARWMMVVLDKK